MSPSDNDSTPHQQTPVRDVARTDTHAQNVVADPSGMREETRSALDASEAQESASRISDASSERMDRLEGLLEGMAQQQAQFMANQMKMQDQMSRRADAAPTHPAEHLFNGSSAFTDFIRARDRRMRRGSLDEPMQNAMPPVTPCMPPPNQPPQQVNQNQPPRSSPNFTPREDYGLKIPKPRDLDWPGFAKFTGKETYPGVGADFKAWGMRFLQRLGAAQLMSGGDWPEEFKVLALSGKLDGAALSYYEKMLPVWSSVSNTLEHVLNSMLLLYMTPIPSTKGIELMISEKDQNKTWPEHYQYLVYVAERSGNSEQSVLECLCKSAPSHIQTAMLTRMNAQRPDYLVQAAELVAFAIDFEISMKKTNSGGGRDRAVRSSRALVVRYPGGGRSDQGGRERRYVARVESADSRKCYGCGEAGHIKANCPKKGDANSVSSRVALAIGTGTTADSDSWILDSGSSVHLVKDAMMLKNVKDCDHSCRAANNTMVRVTKVGTAELKTVVNGKEVIVDLTEVYYAENLADNIISYGLLEERGVFLMREGGQSYVVRQEDNRKIFEVFRRNNVLTIDVMGESTTDARVRVVNLAVQEGFDEIDEAVTDTTLLELHQRLGHLSYDTIVRMADSAGSGIRLTDRTRPNCLTCAQGKQSKNNQPKKDTGRNAPIDKLGGVIGSDIKGPMTPKDRRGNRYLINFVDYSTNYVRVFVAKNKIEATKNFEHFLLYFEKRFNCRIHVLRTDGGKEYVNVDPFCRSAGVRRQISEADNQASNGKAERMHRTILNMARCMLFASGLPLFFWGDAVEYAAYVLNRSSCSANPKRMSPLEMLTGKISNLADMVTFGSPCSAFRDPGKKSWKTRSQVGMVIGKNDETKGFRVYLPKERTVITTQHIRNVETLNSEQNVQLQAQLEREDPMLRRDVSDLDDAAKRKEPHAVILLPSKRASAKTKHDSAESTKDAVKSKRKFSEEEKEPDVSKNYTDLQEAESGDELLPAEEQTRTRMQTRNMGDKHVPVSRVKAISLKDPKNYREAMKDPRVKQWEEAMCTEIEALEHNDTWEVIQKPRDSKLLHSKWVYKLKVHADGSIERFKARLVARGDEQVYGVDYTYTFSAVMEMISGKVILAVSRIWGYLHDTAMCRALMLKRKRR
uniref:Polyprotein n=1 Tax=Peronospora matthiolae TaxID=2874970 RepID=A0AAV1TE31_9STRA